jgi:hypothetical protein
VASPLRSKVFLSNRGPLEDEYSDHILATSRGIITRDRFDVRRCDLLFAYLLGATKVSIGTVMEIAWADMLRTPVVLCIEDKGNIHDHSMIREAIGFRTKSLDQAIDIIESILAPMNKCLV